MHFGMFPKSAKIDHSAIPQGMKVIDFDAVENKTEVAQPLYASTENFLREMRLAGDFNSYREVVVIIPTGSYLDPKELGRYESSTVAYKIMESFPEVEFKMFYLDTGEEVHKQ